MARFLWTQKQDFGPKARAGHAMAFDSNRIKTILFGGDFLTGLFNDTWEWDGEFWTQMADMGPAPRKGHAMAYDSLNFRTVLFGGASGDGVFGDTWSWDGEAWTQLSNSGPQPRNGHAMVFNKARNTILLFGGDSANATLLGDTWEFDGTDWTQLDETGPAARKFHSMAFDPVRSRVVLFGGMTDDSSFGDTWELNGTSWVQTADFGPDKSAGSAMVFTNSRATLYGGLSNFNGNLPSPVFNNSWDWDGKHWTQRQDIGPGARWGHAMCYDAARTSIVLFGGLSAFDVDVNALKGKLLGDTWEHVDTSTATPPGPVANQVSILELSVSPDSVEISRIDTAVVKVKLSGVVTGSPVSIPLFSLPKSIADVQPLDPSVHPAPLATVVVGVGTSTGSINLTGANLQETSVILAAQLDDPATILTAVLTIIPG